MSSLSAAAFLLTSALTDVADEAAVAPGVRLVVVDAVDAPGARSGLPKVAQALGALPALLGQFSGHPVSIHIVGRIVGKVPAVIGDPVRLNAGGYVSGACSRGTPMLD